MRFHTMFIMFHHAISRLRTVPFANGRLLKMVGKAENADHDEIDRHHEVQKARHEQDENSGDQGDQRIEQDRIKSHCFPP